MGNSERRRRRKLDMGGRGRKTLLRGLVSIDALQVVGREIFPAFCWPLNIFLFCCSCPGCFQPKDLNLLSSNPRPSRCLITSPRIQHPLLALGLAGLCLLPRSDPFTNFPSLAFPSLAHQTLLRPFAVLSPDLNHF